MQICHFRQLPNANVIQDSSPHLLVLAQLVLFLVLNAQDLQLIVLSATDPSELSRHVHAILDIITILEHVLFALLVVQHVLQRRIVQLVKMHQ